MSERNSTTERPDDTDDGTHDRSLEGTAEPEDFLTASELEEIGDDPTLEPADVVAHRREKNGLGRIDR